MNAVVDEKYLYRDAFVAAKTKDERMDIATRMVTAFLFRNEWAKFHEASYRFALRHGIIEPSTKQGPRPRKVTMPELAMARDKIHVYARKRNLDYFTEYRMAAMHKKLSNEMSAKEALAIVFLKAQGGQYDAV